ncbi:gluconate 2-dehydrogenase subunit 3 family protein [Mucilaginibacter gynuensis]|uniref:Gluconate 2-dehydrogenase subunit 3 family protein n=1 Tax=Mucilaginibacter gynuensis TaxID=1302236 RepID=A0ABP8HHR9_9SPHI
MDRRIALKNLALIIGGATLFPSDMLAGGKTLIQLKNITISPAQEKLLADVAETIIPKTTTPGAKDLGLHLFVLTMLDDCYGKQDQQAFITGLGELSQLIAKTSTKPFALWPAKQRETLLLGIDNGNYSPELKKFFWIAKDKTVQCYTQSKYFMTKRVVYELIPGRYLVNVPVKPPLKGASK